MRFLATFLVLSTLLLSACSAPAQPIPVGVTSPVTAPAPQDSLIDDGVVEEPAAIETLERADVPVPTDNSSMSERVREARYSTIIDLTELTSYNCEQKLDELDEMLAEALHDEEGVEDDITDQQRRVAKAQTAYEDAKRSSDERDLIRTADDLEQEEDELQDLKNERYKIHRRIVDIKETIDRATPRCMAMVKGRYK